MSETTKHKKRVLVISRNYNNMICMARSLAGGDYDIELVRLIQVNHSIMKLIARFNPERTSKYVSRYHVCIANRDPQVFVKFLVDLYDPERETLLVPCDDLPLPWIDENYEVLSKYFKVSSVGGKGGNLAKIMNKQVQKKLALEFGLPAAACHDINIREGEYEFPEGIKYPCFLKPAVLVMGSKDYLKRYDSEYELIDALDSMAAKFKDVDALVEDFIDIKHEYAVLGLSTADDVIIPDGCLEFLKGAHGSRKGIMVTGEVVSSPEILDFINQLKAFVKSLNYTGLFDIDVLASDKEMYFCELNLRFGGSGYAITGSGVNLPQIYADYMLYNKALPEENNLDGIGKHFVSEKVLLEDCAEHYITRKEAEAEIQMADIHFIMDPEDPAPYKRMRQYFRYTAKIMMTLKNIYKKMH